ncbi:MAG: carbohydrate ABC transporter permease [Candidatus Hydrogenedentota bacterium]
MIGRPQRFLFIVSFLAPAFLLFTGFVAVPGVRALLYSLQRWDGLTEAEWVGFENFRRIVTESDIFLAAVTNNATLMFGAGALILVCSLFFASMLHRRVHGAAVFRVAFFFPNVMAAVAVALVWMLLYSAGQFGVLNALLRVFQSGCHAAGLGWPNWELPVAFTASRYLIYAIVPMMVWMYTGFYMVLFLAAMQSIPQVYYEVARLEGAGPWAQFRLITLPLIRDVLTVAVVFLIITSMKFFDPIWVLENQRPTKDSHVLTTLLYQKVFSEYNVGYGAAVAVLLFVVVFLATLISMRLMRAERVEY